MNFVTRTEWDARSAPNVSTNITPTRTLIHWEGPHMGTPTHDRCRGTVQGIQRYHMDTNGWADIAYSLLVCNHGWVYEGRGLGKRTAANGTNESNQNSYAVCYIGGEGDPFTAMAKDGINDAIAYLGQSTVGGHRDATSTACPGDEIYAWVKAGHPRSGQVIPVPVQEDNDMAVRYSLPNGQVWATDGVWRRYVGNPLDNDVLNDPLNLKLITIPAAKVQGFHDGLVDARTGVDTQWVIATDVARRFDAAAALPPLDVAAVAAAVAAKINVSVGAADIAALVAAELSKRLAS